ncbi:MAG: preprotein translocase subunit SecE [Mangrovibacterium sp.]
MKLGREFFCIYESKFDSYHPNNLKNSIMKLKLYFEEAYNELVHKVSWPTWKELQNSAFIVMVASFIIALVVFLMDISFENIMNLVYSLFY